MAGHNKWSKIKRGKAVADAQRGAVFTKIGNQIALAARGGANPDMNPALALAIEKAKAANMPNTNIERAIARVTDKDAAQLQEVTYEGYGPGGVAIIVECATDNTNRTYPEVRTVFTKRGGSIGEKGSVAFQFDRKGVITVGASGEEALLTVLDAGAEDAVEEDGELIVYTDPKELGKVRDAIKAAGLTITDAELSYEPNTTVELDDEKQEKLMGMMEAFEELDDVVNTYTNAA
ncbi:YebC/PmpR family DNA-binding transcriptional regulator [Candidatus Saccharibacteria bacterium]|nr:YebC/PmpR family DNA-binding transcriptional regulator [Candidatus Saccharibacteria bacterium]MCA9328150.1 YebC/PmpR family DNA-binding transcriptional regulator [Candidatus Saccharibacteria bacterium]